MNARRKAGTKSRLSTVHPHAAGLDVGSTFHVVAVPPEADDEPVRTFRTFSADLQALADWLTRVGVTTIAMESTGVYWVPVLEVLEAKGFEVLLVNARDAKNVPGRKTDVNDAQWLQRLHQHGLLRGSFRPRDELIPLRAYLRQREGLVQDAASQIQRMQKSLMQMNVQLHHVVTDITGVTGLRIIRAIVAGERDCRALAAHRDVRCKASLETIEAALTGNYRDEHVFALKTALDFFDFCQVKIAECDASIESALRGLADAKPMPDRELPPQRHRSGRNEPAFDVRASLFQMVGEDLSQMHGMGPYAALRLVAECGDDMTKWRTAKHFTSWLGLAPGNKISGGKVLSSQTRNTKNRAAALFRLIALNAGRTQTALGAFHRRIAARCGKAKAITATARKLAVLFYNTVRYGMRYADPGADYYEERYRMRVTQNLRRRAASLGYSLVEAPSRVS